MIIFNVLWENVLEVGTVWLPCWCFRHKIWLVYCVVASDLHFPFNSSCIVIEMALKPSHLFIYTDGTPMVNPLPIQALGSKTNLNYRVVLFNMVNILCWSLFRHRSVVSDGLVTSDNNYKLKDVNSGIVLHSRAQNLIFAWSSNSDSLKQRMLKKKCVWIEKKRAWRPWRCHRGWQFLMAHLELTSACPVCPKIPTQKNEQNYCVIRRELTLLIAPRTR